MGISLEKAEAAVKAAGADLKDRAETLSPEQFAVIAGAIF